MHSAAVSVHTRAAREGWLDATARAQRGQDPSWFAYAGYCSASQGRAGAGHLAWERTAPQFFAHRADIRGRGETLNERQLAFVLGYGLGLADHGRLAKSDADELLVALMPTVSCRLPIYQNTRFWLFVSLLFTFTLSLAGAAEVERSDYPTFSAPLELSSEYAEARQHSSLAALTVSELVLAISQGGSGATQETSGAADELVFRLRGMPHAPALETVRHLLAQSGALSALVAIAGLSRIRGVDADCILFGALRADNPEVIAAAMGALVARGDATSVAKLGALLDHETPRIRRLATEAIGVLARPAQAWLLIECLSDRDSGVVQAAHRALVQVLGRDLGLESADWWRFLESRRNNSLVGLH